MEEIQTVMVWTATIRKFFFFFSFFYFFFFFLTIFFFFDSFIVLVTSSHGTEHSVTPQYIGDGKYSVEYIPSDSGYHTIGVTIGGTNIYCGSGRGNKCSPWRRLVAPGLTTHETSIAYGLGLTDAVAGDVAEFWIQARDAYNNNKTNGGESARFEVYMDLRTPSIPVGPNTTTIYPVTFKGVVKDMDDGSGRYFVTYTATIQGSYDLRILYDGLQILSAAVGPDKTAWSQQAFSGRISTVVGASPSVPIPQIAMGLLHPPSSTATGKGLANSVANLPDIFTVHAKDAFSNDRRGTRTPATLGTGSGADDAFLVTLIGPGDTRYITSTAVHEIKFTSSSAPPLLSSLGGTFKITYGDRTTEEIPVTAPAAAVDTAIESLYWPNVRSCTVERIESSDSFIYRVVFTSHLDLWHPTKVLVDGTATTGGTVVISTRASLGAYPVIYTAWTKGQYIIEVTSGRENVHIHGSPFTMTVHDGVVHPETSTAVGNGLTGGVAGDPFQFVLQAKDTRAYEEQSIISSAIRVPTVHEVQMFQCPGGTANWRMSFRGEPTSTLTSTSNIAAVKAALEILPTVGTVAVSYSEAGDSFCAANNVMRITFSSNLDDVPAALFFDPAAPGVTTALTESTKGQAPSRREVQMFVCNADAGTFKVQFRNEKTVAAIPFGTTLADFKTALETVSTIGSVTVTSVGATVCSGSNVYVTFESRTGDLPLLEITDTLTLTTGGVALTPATKQISVTVDGIHPLWGTFTISFRGQVTAPLQHDATAVEVKAALEALTTIGVVTVTESGYGTDVFSRPIQKIWTVRFNKQRYVVVGGDPTNVGPLPLFSTDDSGLLCTTHTRQRKPTLHVNRILLGSTGNAREDEYDRKNVTVLLTHTTRTNHKISMFEKQIMTCTASAGTFTLKFGGQTTLPINWDATAAELLIALKHTNNTFGEITVEFGGSQTTACREHSPEPVTFSMPASFGDAEEIIADPTGLTSSLLYGINGESNSLGDAITILEIIKGGVTVIYKGGLTGQYDITYVPQVKGHYDLKITIESIDIETDLSNGVNVVPAITSGPHSTHTARPFAMEGVSETFIIQARDEFLNELEEESDEL